MHGVQAEYREKQTSKKFFHIQIKLFKIDISENKPA